MREGRKAKMSLSLSVACIIASSSCISCVASFGVVPENHGGRFAFSGAPSVQRTPLARIPPQHRPSLSLSLRMSNRGSDANGETNEIEFVKADDLEALQSLFSRECDEDGLMTKAAIEAVPAIAELVSEGDLLQEELDDIWSAAPKFPDADGGERIDVDSFVQIYRDIDDIFEDEDNDETDGSAAGAAAGAGADAESTTAGEAGTKDGDDATVDRDEAELELVFREICDESTGLATKEMLRQWSEADDLIKDGMLGEDEFAKIWDQTTKKPGAGDKVDVEGFLSFNVALDDLFVFEDDELADDPDSEDSAGDDDRKDETVAVEDKPVQAEPKPIIYGDDLPPGVLFAQIADENYLVGMDELERWGELQDMIAEEDLLPIELQNIFSEMPKAPGTKDKINEDGFTSLFEAIDDLFEDDDTDEDDANGDAELADMSISIKNNLLANIKEVSSDVDLLPCGLDCTEKEHERILEIISELEKQPSNFVLSKGGDIQPEDLNGNWDLLYTSSSAMKYNQGLSGIGGSFPNGKFGGVVQKLEATKYTSDTEYVERIEVNPGVDFDVTVTGDFKLKGTVNLFTGEPTTVLCIEPDKVEYGPTSTKADHWKSLGPLNLLDITYLDESLRVMRGSTSTSTFFVLKRRNS